MTSNQIIKELLTRLYLLHPHIELIQQSYSLSKSLSEPRNEGEAPPNDWLNLALGGEAKVLWDMVNGSPYTPLETELLQRLQYTWDGCYDFTVGDGPFIARACFAPTDVADLKPLQVWFKDGPPWRRPDAENEWAAMEKDL